MSVELWSLLLGDLSLPQLLAGASAGAASAWFLLRLRATAAEGISIESHWGGLGGGVGGWRISAPLASLRGAVVFAGLAIAALSSPAGDASESALDASALRTGEGTIDSGGPGRRP